MEEADLWKVLQCDWLGIAVGAPEAAEYRNTVLAQQVPVSPEG